MNALSGWLYWAKTRWHHTNAQRAMIRDLVEPPLLDVGCGSGWLLEGEGVRIGIDSGKRQGTNRNIHEADITDKWMVGDQTFRTVTAIHVIEHLDPDSVYHLFREAHRVLKPGGLFIVETPSVNRVWRTVDHVKPYPPSAINKWLSRDHYGPVPDFEMIWRWDWGRSSLRLLSPVCHLMANMGLCDPAVHTMVFKKEN